jgi:hypothetical protein
MLACKKRTASDGSEAAEKTRRMNEGCLVAGYGFGGLFGLVVGGGVAIAIGWGDCDRFVGVGEVCGNRFRDVRERADLDYRGLGLLED